MRRWIIVGTLLGVPGCAGPGPAVPGQEAPAPAERASPDRERAAAARVERLERVERPPGSAATTGEVPAALLDRILADAAVRFGVAPGELLVLRAESVTWNDGALGCPRPDVLYTQALEPGYWVVLRAGEAELDYRARTRGDFLLCEAAKEKGLPR